ncbi:uncharacterized protein LOC128738749 [Sabethes cyaneus]|uniref:uncharacterized protein LOC128738749 n=1 Tax=Sabethes cyaneus TaxID=53552 RepID=UPI00237DF3E1|nr:uncharacterized protein LOC128738749 [Sabethes cyaneus]
MAQIKHEPLEIDDPAIVRTGAAGGTVSFVPAIGNCISGAGLQLIMENSNSSSCVMTQDLNIDNVAIEQERNRQEQKRDDEKLEIMHTEEDPLLQETINALMNGTGGIEVVAGAAVVADDIDSERNYECNYCGKLFTRSNTLSYHLKVHNDEKPYKCGSCDKAFREQYRLTKHQRTHAKDFAGNMQHPDHETENSPDSSFQSGGRTGEDEDYATGDSERFFKSYELQESTAVMKLEPDISLTIDGASGNAPSQTPTENDVRYQIIEERIKSLQREVHLVNQNLNRVESKIDGLTKIIAIFVNKFEETNAQTASQSHNNSAIVPYPLVTVPVDSLPPIQTQAVSVSMTQLPTISNVQSIQMMTQQPTAPLAAPPQHHPVAQKLPLPAQQPPSLDAMNGSNIGTAFINSAGAVHSQLGGCGNGINDTFPDVPELPIRTVNDFLDLNDHCTDNEQFLLQMMIRLHQEVDNSQPHQRNVKKMMEALVTYEVLCQFSWSGKSAINGQYTKYVFGNSVGILDLLTKTLNLGKSDEEAEANKKPIFTAIQSFIKHSRQNMLRDSRKRRESNGPYPPALNCPVDRQIKQIKAEKLDNVNQY